MKKIAMSLALAALMLGATACGQSQKEGNDSADSTAMVDTTAIADTAAAEEAPAAPQNPEEVLSLEVVKKNLRYADEASYKVGTWTVKVTNNGAAPVSGNEYVVAYTEMVENDNFDIVKKSRKADGLDVAPGESVDITLKAGKFCQDFKDPHIEAVK